MRRKLTVIEPGQDQSFEIPRLKSGSLALELGILSLAFIINPYPTPKADAHEVVAYEDFVSTTQALRERGSTPEALEYMYADHLWIPMAVGQQLTIDGREGVRLYGASNDDEGQLLTPEGSLFTSLLPGLHSGEAGNILVDRQAGPYVGITNWLPDTAITIEHRPY